MKNFLDRVIENIFSNPQPFVKEGFYALIILLTASLAWAVFNRVVSGFEKRYRDHPVLGKKGQIFQVIRAISLELDWVLRDPAPKVVVKGFGDSAVNLEARVGIRVFFAPSGFWPRCPAKERCG